MFIVLGATGHIGSVVAHALLDRGAEVTVVTRKLDGAREFERRGARVAVADVRDSAELRDVFRTGRRLFLLNPPADPATDTDVEERGTVASILTALEGSGLEKVVAESTYGARPGERVGDLAVLYELERGLEEQAISASVIRGAFYMSNWDAQLESASDTGVLTTFLPTDFVIPMVAPADIGAVAVRLLAEPVNVADTHLVEGPARYSADDVAAALASVVERPVRAVEVPRSRWREKLREDGFSEPAAESFANMTAATLAATFPSPAEVETGPTTLTHYFRSLAARKRRA